jgi:WD40 repeat protein
LSFIPQNTRYIFSAAIHNNYIAVSIINDVTNVNEIRLCDIEEYSEETLFKNFYCDIIVFSPDGTQLILYAVKNRKNYVHCFSIYEHSDGDDNCLKIIKKRKVWSKNLDSYFGSGSENQGRLGNTIVYSPCGKYIALLMIGKIHNVEICDAQTGKTLYCLGDPNQVYNDIIFHPTGDTPLDSPTGDLSVGGPKMYLYSVNENDVVNIWDVEQGKCIKELVLETVYMSAAIAISKDGQYFATTQDGLITIWDAKQLVDENVTIPNECVLKQINLNLNHIEHILFSPNNRHIVTMLENLTILQWDLDKIMQYPLKDLPTFALSKDKLTGFVAEKYLAQFAFHGMKHQLEHVMCPVCDVEMLEYSPEHVSILLCGHVLCKDCLTSLKVLECPTCQKPSLLEDNTEDYI